MTQYLAIFPGSVKRPLCSFYGLQDDVVRPRPIGIRWSNVCDSQKVASLSLAACVRHLLSFSQQFKQVECPLCQTMSLTEASIQHSIHYFENPRGSHEDLAVRRATRRTVRAS